MKLVVVQPNIATETMTSHSRILAAISRLCVRLLASHPRMGRFTRGIFLHQHHPDLEELIKYAWDEEFPEIPADDAVHYVVCYRFLQSLKHSFLNCSFLPVGEFCNQKLV